MNKLNNIPIMPPSVTSDSFADNVLRISLDIGEGLLKSGAEVRRVEFAIEKICHTYGAAHIEVFSINSLILASVRMPDGSYSSQTRRITSISNHLLCLERYNALSRRICEERPSFDEVDEEIRLIKKKAKYPIWLSLLGNMLAAGAFAVFFGGSLSDGLAAMIIGLAVGALSMIRSRYLNDVTQTLFLSIVAGLMTCTLVILGVGKNMDMVAIGTIMLLIPGLWLGNATRDLLYGDTLAGSVKTVQACITAIMIAIGYAVAIFMLGRFCDAPIVTDPFGDIGGIIAGAISAVLGTVGFALMFRISPQKLWIVAFCGLMTFAVYETVFHLSSNLLVSSFASASFLAMFSEICARITKTPSNVFLFTGCIPIVPGSALYYSMYYLLSLDFEHALSHISATLQILFGIALGLILTSVAFGMVFETLEKIKKKAK